jgi:cation diffusion facilitator CzcD-associated flavoprotein CzcO
VPVPPAPSLAVLGSVVIGAGQAGLSASRHLMRLGVDHVVLDANDRPGGAWQHRWDSLTMADVHGVADLPDAPAPGSSRLRANQVVPQWFDGYERRFGLPVLHGVHVDRVSSDGELLVVHAGDRSWSARTLVNATGTWTRPFVPHYPGVEEFAGEQLHTVDYPGREHFVGKRVLVVGGGASAVQFLGELAPVAQTIWVTRRPPVWRTDGFDREAGRAAVALVEDRVRRGLPPRSVVSVTGLALREQEREAERLGAYRRRPMFARVEADGVRWADGSFEQVDVILWATGFRPAVGHLAALRLRSPHGGIQLDGTTAVADPRVQLVGYGPSASTIGANRAGRAAAVAVARQLEPVAA